MQNESGSMVVHYSPNGLKFDSGVALSQQLSRPSKTMRKIYLCNTNNDCCYSRGGFLAQVNYRPVQ